MVSGELPSAQVLTPHYIINKDAIWRPFEQFPGFSEGRPINLYRQRSPSLTADSHPVILFWKQAWKRLSSEKKG